MTPKRLRKLANTVAVIRNSVPPYGDWMHDLQEVEEYLRQQAILQTSLPLGRDFSPILP